MVIFDKIFYLSLFLLFLFAIYLAHKQINNIKLQNLKENFKNQKKVNNLAKVVPVQISFLNKSEAFEKILNANYFEKFNDLDFKLRNCENLRECHELYKRNLANFTLRERGILKSLTRILNNELEKRNLLSLRIIPWVFAKTLSIEAGMPHTHQDTIFLPQSFFSNNENEFVKLRTLLHEKLHIYQRKYPQKTKDYYNTLGFTQISPPKQLNSRKRINPDLDHFDYNFQGITFYTEYKTDAKSIKDVNIVMKTEVPKTPTNAQTPPQAPYDADGDLDSIADPEENSAKLYLTKLQDKGYQIEHPNEIFASKIADDIINEIPLNRDTLYYLR